MTAITAGSRGSKLAMIQTESVVARIREITPHLEVNISKVVTTGDRDRHTRLDSIGTNAFVKELEEALLDGRIDLAVHSLKDMPTDIPRGLCLLAVTERLDPGDALVARLTLGELPSGSRIGTGSLRRALQMAQFRPDIEACSIRGNVDTRLRKVSSGEVDGVIVAAAAMVRLGWEDKITEHLSLERFLPPAGQGTLVIEARSDDRKIADIVTPLNHIPTWQNVTAERTFLRAVGGGCRAPIATLGTISGAVLKLEGMIASVHSKKVLRAVEEGSAGAPEEVGLRLAQKMLGMGGGDFIAEVRGQ